MSIHMYTSPSPPFTVFTMCASLENVYTFVSTPPLIRIYYIVYISGGFESSEWHIWERKFFKEGETGKVRVPGNDRWGRPVVVLDNTVENTKGADDQMCFLAWNLELAMKTMDPSVDKYCCFIHLNEFSFWNMPPMNTTKETMFMLGNSYPERLGHAIVYKPPSVFNTFHSAVTALGVIDAKTQSKVVFIHGDTSDGSPNDLKLRGLLGDNWKALTGAEQKVLSPSGAPKASPGYHHDEYWKGAMRRLSESSSKSPSTSKGSLVSASASTEVAAEGGKSVRSLEGIKNSMPSFDGIGGGGRDYIIVGSNWGSLIPLTLSIPSLSMEEVPIVREEGGDFMVRNISLDDSPQLLGTIYCQDGTTVDCAVSITKVC
jgi:hypothetical protein